jgi:hypothetical protein
VLLAAAGLVIWSAQDRALGAQSDLDTFMREVMEHRDDNWKKLQQYILDEREQFDLRGPGGFPLWGEHREFTWFIQDGFFVRSPLKVNGATIGEADRRKYEDNYLRRVKARDRRERARMAGAGSPDSTPSNQPASADADVPDAADSGVSDSEPAAPADIQSFISQTRQPGSCPPHTSCDSGSTRAVTHSSAAADGRDVLKVETTRRNFSR